MKKIWLLSLFLGLFLTTSLELSAQGKRNNKRPTKKKKEKTNFWKEDVWYGGSMLLNYSANRFSSLFVIGVTPMIGYKIKKTPFSVGPRVGITYVSYKSTGTDGEVHRIGLTSYSTSAFARAKFLRQFFVHVEYELEFKKQIFTDSRGLLALDSDGKVITEKVQQDNFYIGGGYNPGNYEIMLLYNLNVPKNSLEQPFSIRGGFTWNF